MDEMRSSIIEIEGLLKRNLPVGHIAVRWLVGKYRDLQAENADLQAIVDKLAEIELLVQEMKDRCKAAEAAKVATATREKGDGTQ